MSELYSKIEEWNEVSARLKAMKERESELRMDICDELLEGKMPGVHNFNIEYFQVKATRKLNYALDQKAINEMYVNGELTQEEEDLIRIKYTLNMKNYKEAVCDTTRIDEHLTVKDAMPTLDVTV